MVAFGGLRSLAWEPEVSRLHAIFDLKGMQLSIPQAGYSKVKTQGIPHEMYRAVYYVFVVYGSISQDEEVSLEENHRRNTNNDQPPKDYRSKFMKELTSIYCKFQLEMSLRMTLLGLMTNCLR
jgi:hypothetical protein